MARLTAGTALTLYLGLGGDRSLAKVAAGVPAGDRVSMKTLKQWSARDGWGKLAKAHDRKVTTRANEVLVATQGREQASAALAMDKFAQAAFAKAAELVGTAENVADLAVMVTSAVDALKQLAVMTGGVSDRTEAVAAPAKAKTPAERQADLEAKYGLGAGAGATSAAPAKPH